MLLCLSFLHPCLPAPPPPPIPGQKRSWNELVPWQPAFPPRVVANKTNKGCVVCLKIASTQPAAALSAPAPRCQGITGSATVLLPICCLGCFKSHIKVFASF